MWRSDAKPWKCKGGHVLGMVVRNGNGTRELMLFRHAIQSAEELGEEEMAEVDVMGLVVGRVVDVRCGICGRVRTWVEDE